jgi:hypothetical protein
MARARAEARGGEAEFWDLGDLVVGIGEPQAFCYDPSLKCVLCLRLLASR